MGEQWQALRIMKKSICYAIYGWITKGSSPRLQQ